MHEHHSRRGTRPSLEEISTTLKSIVRDYSRVYLVVDALDECPAEDGTRSKLLAEIRGLQKEKGIDLRLMVTSRFIPDIEDKFKEVLRLEVRASDKDIEKFVTGRIGWLPNIIQRNKELKDLVKNERTQAMDGMFLLARLYIDSLLDKNTKAKVKSALKKISKSSNTNLIKVYDKVYNEVLTRIEGQLPENKKMVKKVLSWITYTERQFTTSELYHVLVVELGELDEDDFSGGEDITAIYTSLETKELDKDNIPDIDNIVSVCTGLVTVDKKSNIIRLIHYTTQEYFQRTREKWFPFTQISITLTCLTYLSFSTFKSGSCYNYKEFKSRLEENVFLDYTSQYWGQHVRIVQE